jgi:hypothetical protein
MFGKGYARVFQTTWMSNSMTRGSRNGIAILDSDKTLICLGKALHFIGPPSRQKRTFLLFKDQSFI